ncbi:DNA replication protein [Xenorhabdus sp. DI]|uniref:replication protein P n=1 Tax=Xenorhabdus doucetiae TaxID=351671 RepID=UPI0019A0D6BB|nr:MULTISPECIES: replication protein P [unclassified Xenorhabdus]MBD2785404.1 DNA replication protein [Xenorhabdus sp. 3]MBD2788428.1 DNA replication protein [Xenorhabdus sp. DI]
MRNITTAIQNRDGRALRAMSEPAKPQGWQVTKQIAEIFNELFRQLKGAFPALMASIKTQGDFDELRRQWVLAFAENGIRTIEQVNAGMKIARQQDSPFLPSPGQFVEWCKQGGIQNAGLPDESELYDMIMTYSAKRGLYSTPESYPWPSHACYWMVTKLYSQMMGLNLSEPELRKRCRQELISMSRRMESGEQIPEPKVQLTELHIPTSNERALNHLAEIRRKFNLKPHKKDF